MALQTYIARLSAHKKEKVAPGPNQGNSIVGKVWGFLSRIDRRTRLRLNRGQERKMRQNSNFAIKAERSHS